MSPNEIEGLSAEILKNFSRLSFSGIKYLHTFYPIVGKHEFNSLLLVDWLRKNHPQIKLVLPKSNLNNHTLEHILWSEDTPLAVNAWGITEPEYGETILPGQMDMVLVPLLTFDKKGNRIGYGKGFYDRFLSECNPDTVKAGISMFEPEGSFEDVDQFDIPLDLCITPHTVWLFDKN